MWAERKPQPIWSLLERASPLLCALTTYLKPKKCQTYLEHIENGVQKHVEKRTKRKRFETKLTINKRLFMQKELKIRKATPQDWNKILPLFEQLYHGDIGPNLKNAFTNLTKNKEDTILVAEQNQKLLGALVANYYVDLDWEGRIAKLQAIIVDEKHRKQGIGKKLFHHFLAQAKKNNCRAITLRVNRKNKIACLFYEKLNFAEAETNEYILEP